MTDKDTFFSRAQADADLESQGRFKKEVSAEVIAKEPLVKYPDQPTSSPFANDPAGTEPALGYDINEQVPIGGPPVEVVEAVPFRRRV